MNSSVSNGSCLARVRAYCPREGGSTQRIARQILEHPQDVLPMSIVQIAGVCETSPSTVTRFCRILGYSGFKEFQLDLATTLANYSPDVEESFDKSDSPGSIIRRVFERNKQSLEDTLSLLDEKTMDRVAIALTRARRIYLLGIGGSGLVAREAAQRFMSLGLTAIAVFDPYDQVFATSNVGREDVIFGISHTGRTLSVLEGIREARRHHAHVIVVTNYPDSPLAKESHERLITSYREHRFNAAVSSSRIAQMCIFDALYFMVGSRTSEEARRLAKSAEERVQRLLRNRYSRTSVATKDRSVPSEEKMMSDE